MAEADQRAAELAGARMPALLASVVDGELVALSAGEPAAEEETGSPYQRIAADLRAIRCGALRPGDPLPTNKDLAARYGVSVATAHRGVEPLTSAGEVGLPGQARDRGGAVRSAGLGRSSGLAFSPAAQRRSTSSDLRKVGKVRS